MLSELVVGRPLNVNETCDVIKRGFSIGPFDSEAFGFQEETKNTQGRLFYTL